jgi:hypothetical protein
MLITLQNDQQQTNYKVMQFCIGTVNNKNVLNASFSQFSSFVLLFYIFSNLLFLKINSNIIFSSISLTIFNYTYL